MIMAAASSSSIRVVFGSLLCRFSYGVCLKQSTSISVQTPNFQFCEKVRTFSPLCMGRRSYKIAARKVREIKRKLLELDDVGLYTQTGSYEINNSDRHLRCNGGPVSIEILYG